MPMTQSDKDPIGKRHRTRQARIAAELGKAGFALPGTVLVRTTCGKKNCGCHADPPRLHGPYVQWTRKINQKTVTRNLTDEQWQRYKEWFENAKRLRELLADLETLSMEIFEQDS
ncbi:MAG: hypothetical protein M0035_03460 [Actinomycetota bacterium]|jgi:hypothetical protein|nr:hypothetical protein [Actinomycetota bacterium]